MKAVFLVINYMPHQLVSINALINNYQAEVHAFAYKTNTKIPVNTKNLLTYRLRDFSQTDFLKRLIEIKPDIMVVAGWAVPDFVWAAKKIRKKLNIPVVSYSDTQWRNTWKQKVNCMVSPWHLKKAFSHIWVAGIYQFEYARKLGFSKDKIIYNALSCNVELFKQVSLEQKQTNYPKNFLFIGRFVQTKGIDLLINAWNQITNKKGWVLTLIGDGEKKDNYKNIPGVTIKNFMPQTELISEMEQAGCFILPSVFEPWALVIHEAAAAGLPIIATDVCGAAPHFVISGYNGYQITPSVESIKNAMEKIMEMNSIQLMQFSQNSRNLASSITPDLGAAQLMSILYKNELA